MLAWFLAFIVMHVTLVFTTGLLRNLNHVFAARDSGSWVGFWVTIAATVKPTATTRPFRVFAWTAATRPCALRLAT